MSIAVVPIFMSAGAAVLPTVIVAVTSVLAIIFKPRELLRLCLQRPLIALASLGGVVVIALAITWWLITPARAAVRQTAASHTNWAQVAISLLATGKDPTAIAGPAATDQPLVVGHDFTRASYAGGPSPIKLRMVWNYHPQNSLFLASPLVAGKRIYVAACQSDLGGYTGLLACLDAAHGNKALWETSQLADENLKPFFSSPALTADGKSLIVGQGLHQDTDCSLMCFDTDTGHLRWAVKTPIHIESSPAIFGDIAVVGAGAIEGAGGRAIGNPGYVFAVRISDGKELWQQPVNDPESDPAIDENGIVYIGSGYNGQEVVAMRSDTNEDLKAKNLPRILWRRPVDFPATSPITIAGDLIISGSGNGDVAHSAEDPKGLVVALDRATGEVRWRRDFEDSVLGAVAVRDGLAICPVRTGQVVALSLKDGSVVWHQRISGNAPVLAGCAVTDSKVYAVSSDGYLVTLNLKDGTPIESHYLNSQSNPGSNLSVSSPQVAGGRIVVGSETGGLYCLEGSSE